ncbi:MAG: alpha/beta hydrolase [Candidatus Woesearchaeota archaeon]
MKAVILPGNNNCRITSNWYLSVKDGLEKQGMEVIAEDMPDPKLARKEYWLPFIKEKLGGDEDAVLIGHSSGAIAIMKFLEENKCGVAVLVGAYYTDLGDELERKSGYFDEPWDWEAIRKNAGRIVIFASQDDPYIGISEPRFMKDKLDAEYHEFEDRGHFEDREMPELMEVLGRLPEGAKNT